MAIPDKPKETADGSATTPQKLAASPSGTSKKTATKAPAPRPRCRSRSPAVSADQLGWLGRGMVEPGGKLPLFDQFGQRVKPKLVEACIRAGWAERWFENPLKPDWLVCRLTDRGRALLQSRHNVVSLGPSSAPTSATRTMCPEE